MTNEDRVARHLETISRIREDIEWIKAVRFRIGASGPDELIAEQERLIAMYGMFIEKLEGR